MYISILGWYIQIMYTRYIHVYPVLNMRFSMVIRVITPSTGLGSIQSDLVDTTCSRMHCHDSIQSIQSIRRCFWYASIWTGSWRNLTGRSRSPLKTEASCRSAASRIWNVSEAHLKPQSLAPIRGTPKSTSSRLGHPPISFLLWLLWARFEFQPLMHVQFCQVRSTILGNRKRDAGWVQCPDLPRCWHSWHPNGCKPYQQDERGRNPRPAQTHVPKI